jgi:hypothetical protein
MQIRNLLAQSRLIDAWNAQRATDPAKGLRNTAALLHHLGDLVTIYTDWEFHPIPKHHCLVGVPEHYRAREDVALLSPELYGETASFPDKLSGWLAEAKAWLSPTGLELPPATSPAFALPLPALTQPAATKSSVAAQTAATKKRKMKTEEGEKDLKPPPKKATASATGGPTRVVATVLPTTAVPVANDPSKFKARKPLICWTQVGQATYPACIGGLMYALKSSPVVLPTVEQSHVCFPFLIVAPNNGCDSTMRQHGPDGHRHASGRKLRKACNRLHVDISVSSDGWTKEILQPLWDFVKHPNVQLSIVPSAASVAFMTP